MLFKKSKSRLVSDSLFASTQVKANGFLRKEVPLVLRIDALKADIAKLGKSKLSLDRYALKMKENKLAVVENKLRRLARNRSKFELRLDRYESNNKAIGGKIKI